MNKIDFRSRLFKPPAITPEHRRRHLEARGPLHISPAELAWLEAYDLGRAFSNQYGALLTGLIDGVHAHERAEAGG